MAVGDTAIRGPYPLLVVSGKQGSAKTVLSKLLRALVDPNAAAVRALPREERELMIAGNNGHLLAFDNLSNLPAGLSDALCRLASGGSFAVRRLYSDDEEVLFQAPRPILLNGIEADIRLDDAEGKVFPRLPKVSSLRPPSKYEKPVISSKSYQFSPPAAAESVARLSELPLSRQIATSRFSSWRALGIR